MNDVEKRRLQLLEETRNYYSIKYNPPAIHPRYQSAFFATQSEEDVLVHTKHTWVIRSVIALLIFSLFYLMDTRNEKIGTIDSQRVVQEVQRDLLSK